MKGRIVLVFIIIFAAARGASAELRKRVRIDVSAPDTVSAKLIEGTLARELGRCRDVLVIDDRYEQSSLPFMKYKAHVVVQIDVIQMYSNAIEPPRGILSRIGSGVGTAFEYTIALGTLGLGAIPFNAVRDALGDEPPGRRPMRIEGRFVANVGLFDMWTERTFARTQTDLTVLIHNTIHDNDEVMLSAIAREGFQDLGKWIQRETRRRPGQTWVFCEPGGPVLVNAGRLDGVKPGQRLDLYAPEPVHAPDSREIVARMARYIGKIKIVQVDDLFSIANAGQLDLNGEYISK